MIKLTVTTTLKTNSSSNANLWFVFEANYNNFDDLYDALAEDGCISGERVFTKDGGFGHRVVTHRVPHIVGVNGVATIAPCHVEYVDTPAVPA